MNNDLDVSTVEFDLKLPQGIVLVTEDGNYRLDLNTERTTNQWHDMVSIENTIADTYHVHIRSSKNKSFSGQTGKICQLYLEPSKTQKQVNGEIQIKNICLTDESGIEVKPNDNVCNIKTNIINHISTVTSTQGETIYYSIDGKRIAAPKREKSTIKKISKNTQLVL